MAVLRGREPGQKGRGRAWVYSRVWGDTGWFHTEGDMVRLIMVTILNLSSCCMVTGLQKAKERDWAGGGGWGPCQGASYGGVTWGGDREMGKVMDSGHILKTEPTGFADGLDGDEGRGNERNQGKLDFLA